MGRVLGTTQDESGWIVATHKHTSKATFIGYPGTSPQKELIYFNPSTDWQKTILYNSIKWVKVRSWLGEYVICITSTDLWLPWDCAWLHFRDNYVCCRGSLLCVATCYHFAILWKNICKYYFNLLSICYHLLPFLFLTRDEYDTPSRWWNKVFIVPGDAATSCMELAYDSIIGRW